MQQHLFYVSRLGQQYGPMTLDEIVERVRNRFFETSDYLYDEDTQEWVMLIAHIRLSQRFNEWKPPVPPHKVAGSSEEKEQKDWYVLKGENMFGPFTHLEVISMLQAKLVYEYDYVWVNHLSAWERIATLADFSEDSIRGLRNSNSGGVNQVFFRRRFARVSCGVSILVHNNRKVFKGTSVEIGQGGAGILLDTSSLKPGDRIYLHFKPGDGVMPFNAACEVMSKRVVENSSGRRQARYGLKFIAVAKEATEAIARLAKERIVDQPGLDPEKEVPVRRLDSSVEGLASNHEAGATASQGPSQHQELSQEKPRKPAA